MARDYFRHLADGLPRVRGTVISDIQGTLNALTTSSIEVDGDFGKQTEDALTVFQTAPTACR
jgi:peptidoglycan hydrolase-like protein with peptidoglycan-binding domain